MSETYYVDLSITVKVVVNEPSVIDRVVQNEDNWQGTFYAMTERDEVLNHLAYNRIANGYTGVNLLDGWADLDEKAVDMSLYIVDYEGCSADPE